MLTKTRFFWFGLALVSLLILSMRVYGADQTIYTIQLNSQGSASWTIRQTGTDILVSPETVTQFQSNVTSLMLAAESITDREMAITALSVTSTVSGSYAEVEYTFIWQNFSVTENSTIVVGDVFQVDNFFGRICGDGEVTVTYPQGYVLETVSPPPIQQDATHQILEWAGTKDFTSGSPSIVLREKPTGFLDILGQNGMITVGVVAVAAVSLAGYYTFGRKRKKIRSNQETEASVQLEIETDEEKVVKLLRSSGGKLFQSAITEKCNFSKAKASQLLSSLENKRIVTRYKRGRDKIVTLIDENRK